MEWAGVRSSVACGGWVECDGTTMGGNGRGDQVDRSMS
jgi:hypothetical protein